jgi:hypothetical protein
MAAAAAFTPALKNIRPGGYFSELGNKFSLEADKNLFISGTRSLRAARAAQVPPGGLDGLYFRLSCRSTLWAGVLDEWRTV